MTAILQTRKSGRRAHIWNLKKLTFAAAIALTMGTGTAVAQTGEAADEDTTEDIYVMDVFEVVGIRQSYEKALEIKRQSNQLVDSIVAEDIGKFPDNNVVEALQRVSGVQVTDRSSGEVSGVSIRGLSDITTTINGHNIFTASGRSVALQDIPASLLARVDVFKTRSAEQIETGIAGVIDIRTHRPFNFDGDRYSVAIRGIYQELSEEFDPNISLLASKTWDTKYGKFGALVNVSYAKTNYRDQSVTAGAMVPFVTDDPPDPWVPYERIFLTRDGVAEDPIWQAGLEAGLPTAEGSTLTMNGEEVEYVLSRDAIFQSDFTGERERPAANISLQWAPNENSEYTFEVFYDGYRNNSFNDLLFSFADWWGDLGDNAAENVVLYPGTNIVKERKNVGSVYSFSSGDYTHSKTDSWLYSLGGKWKIGENFHLASEGIYQTSKYTTEFIAMRIDRVAPSLNVDFNSNDGIPAFNFPDDPSTTGVDESDLTNPALWNIAELYDNAGYTKGDALTFKVDGTYYPTWGFIKNIKGGLRWDDRSASEGERTADAGALGRPLADYTELCYVNSDFFDGESDVPRSWVTPDGEYLNDHADEIRKLYNDTMDANNSTDPRLLTGNDLVCEENFNVDEVTTSAYLQSAFSTVIMDRTLSGELGFRYVNVETDMNFFDDQRVKSSADASASKVLPSATISYELVKDLRMRVSYGETLRRPNFTDLNPNITYVEDVTNIGYGTATGGNSGLKPTESKNYDISLEYYLSNASALYVTAFKRKIDGLVVSFRKRVTHEDYDYILTQPDNASDGELKGWEFGAVYFPENLPEIFKGFGVQASYTILDSTQTNPVTNDVGEVVSYKKSSMFGVSDTSYSVVLAYERGKFSSRLSYVWRDDFLYNYEAAQFANPLGIYHKAERSLDFQLTYNITKNWAISLDATNLTDEVYQSYYEDSSTNNFGSWKSGRTLAIGTRYSF